jgi:hypothetical protein
MVSQGQPDSLSIHGQVLQFYLNLITNATQHFDKPEMYYLHTYHLRSLITDPDYIKGIDTAIERKREEFKTMAGPEGRPLDNKTKSFLECFCIVENCMKFLDYTMKITKRDVEINADQTDEGMPGKVYAEPSESTV